MECNLDVNRYVFRNIQETVGNLGQIDIQSGEGLITQGFGSKNLETIANLNTAFKEKVISYFPSTDTDLPGTIKVTLSDRIYRYYLKKYGNNKSEINKDNQLSLFDETPTIALDINTVTVSKTGMVNINNQLIPFKDVNYASLEAKGFTIKQIGEILKKIC